MIYVIDYAESILVMAQILILYYSIVYIKKETGAGMTGSNQSKMAHQMKRSNKYLPKNKII